MSFWNKALKVAKDTGSSMAKELAKQADELREIRAEYETMSNDELFDVIKDNGFFGTSPMQKRVARIILRNRGFDDIDIDELTR